MRAFSHGTRMRQMGADPADYEGKPIIAIVNTWSELNPCHMHLRERAEQVKRGIWEAGGFPAEFGVASLSETFQKPTPMLYRNLLAMDTEELLRSYPADGAVLMGGCDKTTPALIMGAASAGIPAIYLPAGPMLRGNYRGATLGSGTDLWKYWDDKRAGLIGDCEMADLAGGIARSPGHCMTMGTASTMTSAAEALGMTLPGAASIPAVDSAHYRMATATGRRIVDMAWEHLTPDQILTAEAFEDAVATVLALGGSTNAVIHLIAMAGRCGVPLSLDDFDDIARRVPVLANVRPGGKYLMEDFYYAGGLRALLARLAEVPGALHTDRITVTGRAAGRAAGRGPGLQLRRHPRTGDRAGRRSRPGRAPRQPGPGRGGDQAHRGRARAAQAHRPGGRLRQLPGDAAADQRPGAGRDRRLRARAAQRRPARAARACRSTGCCPSRTTCWPRACGTWSGSPTPG